MLIDFFADSSPLNKECFCLIGPDRGSHKSVTDRNHHRTLPMMLMAQNDDRIRSVLRRTISSGCKRVTETTVGFGVHFPNYAVRTRGITVVSRNGIVGVYKRSGRCLVFALRSRVRMVVRLSKAAGESCRKESKSCNSLVLHCRLHLFFGWCFAKKIFPVQPAHSPWSRQRRSVDDRPTPLQQLQNRSHPAYPIYLHVGQTEHL